MVLSHHMHIVNSKSCTICTHCLYGYMDLNFTVENILVYYIIRHSATIFSFNNFFIFDPERGSFKNKRSVICIVLKAPLGKKISKLSPAVGLWLPCKVTMLPACLGLEESKSISTYPILHPPKRWHSPISWGGLYCGAVTHNAGIWTLHWAWWCRDLSPLEHGKEYAVRTSVRAQRSVKSGK